VGIYVPGGKAAYPSTVLMNAIPASVAGVDEIVMVTPFPRGEVSPHVLVAADLAGVDRIFKVGGAQAVGALAYGTPSIPKVDKIVGPGNIYVALAKRQVFGAVDIDMIAGPSEVIVISDGKTDPLWTAADLLSQAEHDEKASAVLITWNAAFVEKVKEAIQKILKLLPRAAIARRSLRDHGALILTRSEREAAELSNAIAPEHLELSVKDADSLLKKIRHAGAVFLGPLTTESFGDYLAGPNHVLPTSGTARFASPLSTLDFLKFSSVIACEGRAAKKLGPSVVRLAELEGLHAHALAMRLRFTPTI
jgi:histidinol dehydrogenase